MVNRVTIVGNLGADPEANTTKSGGTVCNLRVAATSRTKKGEEWVDETEWFRVVVFGRQAESCAKFLAKGRQVYVEGRMRTNKWQDRDGNDRYTTEVIARDVRFLGSKSDAPVRGGTGQAGSYDDSEVPF